MNMNDVSLRANRLANEFEGLAGAVRESRTLDQTIYQYVGIDAESPTGEVTHTITCDKLEEAAGLLRERGNGVTLADEQMRALRIAVNGLPYGGLAMHRGGELKTVEQLIERLNAMRDVLSGVASRATDAEHELHTLKRERDAVRSFIGITELDERLTLVEDRAAALVEGGA